VIAGFDHVVIAVRDLAAATETYETLLGRSSVNQGVRDGVATALIALENIAVELMAPEGEGETGRRLRAALEDGEGLKSLVFATPDIGRAHRRCERVGLAPDAVADREKLLSFRADTERTHGLRLFFLQRDEMLAPAAPREAGVLGLDHVVIRSADMERAAALYGARLGLDMRLDREVGGRRLMFFRCGDAIVEIAHDPARDRDQLWGLSWQVADADAARARLAGAGLDVSDVRAGMKPGTRVFTVRDGTCHVPTLMIAQSLGTG
jgi:catechol 2,3-dioxygenase-like lactoylglutathione lyase family enzyme